MILDVGDDPLHTRGFGIVAIFVVVGFFLPMAPIDIEVVAEFIFILAPSPSEVHAPNRRGMPVGQRRQRLARIAV